MLTHVRFDPLSETSGGGATPPSTPELLTTAALKESEKKTLVTIATGRGLSEVPDAQLKAIDSATAPRDVEKVVDTAFVDWMEAEGVIRAGHSRDQWLEYLAAASSPEDKIARRGLVMERIEAYKEYLILRNRYTEGELATQPAIDAEKFADVTDRQGFREVLARLAKRPVELKKLVTAPIDVGNNVSVLEEKGVVHLRWSSGDGEFAFQLDPAKFQTKDVMSTEAFTAFLKSRVHDRSAMEIFNLFAHEHPLARIQNMTLSGAFNIARVAEHALYKNVKIADQAIGCISGNATTTVEGLIAEGACAVDLQLAKARLKGLYFRKAQGAMVTGSLDEAVWDTTGVGRGAFSPRALGLSMKRMRFLGEKHGPQKMCMGLQIYAEDTSALIEGPPNKEEPLFGVGNRARIIPYPAYSAMAPAHNKAFDAARFILDLQSFGLATSNQETVGTFPGHVGTPIRYRDAEGLRQDVRMYSARIYLPDSKNEPGERTSLQLVFPLTPEDRRAPASLFVVTAPRTSEAVDREKRKEFKSESYDMSFHAHAALAALALIRKRQELDWNEYSARVASDLADAKRRIEERSRVIEVSSETPRGHIPRSSADVAAV